MGGSKAYFGKKRISDSARRPYRWGASPLLQPSTAAALLHCAHDATTAGIRCTLVLESTSPCDFCGRSLCISQTAKTNKHLVPLVWDFRPRARLVQTTLGVRSRPCFDCLRTRFDSPLHNLWTPAMRLGLRRARNAATCPTHVHCKNYSDD